MVQYLQMRIGSGTAKEAASAGLGTLQLDALQVRIRRTDRINTEEGEMTQATAFVTSLTSAELDDRRMAVDNAVGTMRIEDLEPDETTKQILYRYERGEIPLGEMNRLIHDYTSTIL
jgi:hypothetical protein